MRLLALLSGGIDSPVAAWMMRNLGHQVDFVHFHNYTPQQASVRQKVVELAKVLGGGKLWMVPFRDVQLEIVKAVPSKYRMIVYRRFMHRIAVAIAVREGHDALVTGDNLAQVASQTLDNMYVINAASKLQVLRPLLGAEKNDTVNRAKEIGTYGLSIQPYSDCCTFMIAERPETHANLNAIEEAEAKLGVDILVAKAVEKAELMEV